MSKKYIILSGVLVAVVAVGLLGRWYFNSSNCWEPTTLYLRSAGAIFSPDENSAFFVVAPDYFQLGRGICAFPDGSARTLHESIDVYAFDMKAKTMQRVVTWNAKLSGSSDMFTLTHKANGKAYGVVATEPITYLEIDTVAHGARMLTNTEYHAITRALAPMRGSFDATADGRYIELEEEGNAYTLVEKNWQVPGLAPQVLMRGTAWLPYSY